MSLCQTVSNACLAITRKVEPKARNRYTVSVRTMARQVEERKDQKMRENMRSSREKGERWGVP